MNATNYYPHIGSVFWNSKLAYIFINAYKAVRVQAHAASLWNPISATKWTYNECILREHNVCINLATVRRFQLPDE